MSTSTLDFYFDYSSPYAYLASTQIDTLAADIGRSVRWHPILLGPMFQTMGSAPLVQIPLKGDYALRDFARTARIFDIAYATPDPFPISTVAAARATLAVRRHDMGQAAEFAKRLFAAYFVDGRDLREPEVILDVASRAGIDRDALAAAMVSDDIKAELKRDVEQAIQRGVFGSPFVFVDDEPFWGFDRFPHIRRWAAMPAHSR